MLKAKFLLCAVLAVVLASCADKNQEFVIKGSTSQERLDGNRVFLVPYGSKQIEDSIGVDSVVIEDGKFEFRGRGEYLARITMDRRVRYGTQDLLIVTEPGEITVVIDSVSSAAGTPQNEGLQQWKDLKTEHDRVVINKRQLYKHLRQIGDTAAADALTDSIRQYNKQYRNQIEAITRIMGPGPGTDFLNNFFGFGQPEKVEKPAPAGNAPQERRPGRGRNNAHRNSDTTGANDANGG